MTLSDLTAGYVQGGGSLSGDTLAKRGRAAWSLLTGQTRDRVRTLLREDDNWSRVQGCFDRLVETEEILGEGGIQSETLGQWQRTYRSLGQRSGDLAKILRESLGETGLLYRGWDG